MQVLSMNAPSSALSIKYSLQCALIACATEADGASAVTRNACLDDIVSCEICDDDALEIHIVKSAAVAKMQFVPKYYGYTLCN